MIGYLLIKPVELPAAWCVWAATKQASYLHGRFLWTDWGVDELYYFSQPLQTFRLTSAKVMFTTGYHDIGSRLQTLTIMKAEVSGHAISASTMIITSALYQNSG